MEESGYRRVLLKISGEGFSGTGGFGVTPEALSSLASVIGEMHGLGVQIAVVNGAGNLVRGAKLSESVGLRRDTADQMGMLATVINALSLQDALEARGLPVTTLSAANVTSICEPFRSRRAEEALQAGRILLLAGGTGNPFFTTDTAAALRAAEIGAGALIKATKVDGVYDKDPVKFPDAHLYDKLDYRDIFRDDLHVMDHAAISICRENKIDVIVCNLMTPGVVAGIIRGERIGTLITQL